MNSYHRDLRGKVYILRRIVTHSERASKLFGVCVDSISRWREQKSTTGSLEAVFVPRSPPKLIRKALVECLEEHPDALLREIAGHFKCGIETVRYALLKLGITRKKPKNTKKGMKKSVKNSKKR